MRRLVRRIGVVTVLAAAFCGRLSAQPGVRSNGQGSTTSTDDAVVVRGTVFRGSSGGERALAGQMVVLHRVSPAGAGPVDSMRSLRDGTFRMTFRPDSGVLYLLSARYDGIGYFSTPLADDVAAAQPADIVVYDTSSVARKVLLGGRHVIVSAPAVNGQRTIVEVFELTNDSSVTMISNNDASPVWRLRLPDRTIEPRVGEGEFASEAVRFEEGEVQLFAPLPPGMKQLVVSYALPPSAFPLSMPMQRAATVLEVLIEEREGRVQGAKLASQPAVTVGGRQFQRALARDIDSSAVFTIALPIVAAPGFGAWIWLAIPAALLLTSGAWWYAYRRPLTAARLRVPEVPVVQQDERQSTEALANRVAALDALLDQPSVGLAARDKYLAERSRAMAALRDALAAARSD
ncbi:MAG: hypothetical protein MNPFHGCM_01572 [Gemmatimonadaceae bacterium]|nr:hypothetical protein [Gemmatimonadaceae bacterium]